MTVISLKVSPTPPSADAWNVLTLPPCVILKLSAIAWCGHPGVRLKAFRSFLAAATSWEVIDPRSLRIDIPGPSTSSSPTASPAVTSIC